MPALQSASNDHRVAFIADNRGLRTTFTKMTGFNPPVKIPRPVVCTTNGIQYRPSLEVVPCTSGVPCTARYVAVFGFISIPFMAGAAFLLIAALLLVLRSLERATAQSEAVEEAPPA